MDSIPSSTQRKDLTVPLYRVGSVRSFWRRRRRRRRRLRSSDLRTAGDVERETSYARVYIIYAHRLCGTPDFVCMDALIRLCAHPRPPEFNSIVMKKRREGRFDLLDRGKTNLNYFHNPFHIESLEFICKDRRPF